MRFWDASAVVPLCVDEGTSILVRRLTEEDPGMTVWWATLVECWSAFVRSHRKGLLDQEEEERARLALARLQRLWIEIAPGEEVRSQAGRLLRIHPLRSSDALQLAAALLWAGTPPAGEIVVFDDRLREAARLEGLTPLP